MEEDERQTGRNSKAPDHLCILVHGLWGNPQHLWYLRQALEEKYGKDELVVVVATRNSDMMTYDGIEVGAERVAQEVEDEIERLETEGTHIKKLSIVGYSLGGLISRYAVGLLYSRGWFDKLEPVNFTTFASPHLGVRAPLRGYHTSVWNYLGGRTISQSGRQLFLIDSFRDDGRPLLSILADPKSIFMKALCCFKNRILYANIINDRSAPYYTTYIARYDPFVDLSKIDIKYLEGYEPIILDPSKPISIAKPPEPLPLYSRVISTCSSLLTQLPLYAMLSVLAPIGTAVFLVNSGIQHVRSTQRIKLHEQSQAVLGVKAFRIPLMIENARVAVEGAIETAAANEAPQYLTDAEEETASSERTNGEKSHEAPRPPVKRRMSISNHGFPTLALAPEQFEMIENLDRAGFRKYAVYIHEVRHSHAAIIMRRKTGGSKEGMVVVRHWLDEEFEL